MVIPIPLLLSVILLGWPASPSGAQQAHPAETGPEHVHHAAILRNLDQKTFARGRELYARSCAACHGGEGVASLPAARSFSVDSLRYGSDPYSMWRTVTQGRGAMPSQTWLTPEERYHVIQYIREELIRRHNPDQYFEVSESYLAALPKSEERERTPEEIARDFARGLQSAGQEWATTTPGDYGPRIMSQLEGRTSAALTVALDHRVRLAYDLLRMRLAAAWVGGLDLSDTKFTRYRGEGQPRIEGRILDGLESWRWRSPAGETGAGGDGALSPRTPLPERRVAYQGHYAHGDHTILAYTADGVEVLEMPVARSLDSFLVLEHTLRIGPSEQALVLEAAGVPAGDGWEAEVRFFGPGGTSPPLVPVGAEGLVGVAEATNDEGENRVVAVGVGGDVDGIAWDVGENGAFLLVIPPRAGSIDLRVLRWAGESASEAAAVKALLRAVGDLAEPIADLRELTRGGPPRWPEVVVNRGRLDVPRPRLHSPAEDHDDGSEEPEHVEIPDDYPYTVDEIGLPFDNPWNSWIRPTAVAFLDDGRLVLTTYVGDVWLASGIDDDLEEIRWKRIATGLYEPMGVAVVGAEIHVTARDRIVRLRDLDGDDYIDFYGSFYADQDVSDFFHAFAFGLGRDEAGYFYYAKSGQYTSNALPGDVVRVAPDGSRGVTIATGFRTPNGLTVAPDGRIFVSDNQGNWTPANEINLIEPGGFYGYVPNIGTRHWAPDDLQRRLPEEAWKATLAEVPVPDSFTEPVLWLPQEFDNSPGGGTWSDPRWGPLGDRLIHTSFGKGQIYQVMLQTVDGVTQAAAVALPFQFDAGTQRAAVNPADGQVYVTGLTGWDDAFARRYGHLDRIRYTAGFGRLITDVAVRPDGLALTFNAPLDSVAAGRPELYEALMWNYEWARRYGSNDWSVRTPGVEGRDRLRISGVDVSSDARTLLLRLPDLVPADQVRLRLHVPFADGSTAEETVYLTVHSLPAPDAAPAAPPPSGRSR